MTNDTKRARWKPTLPVRRERPATALIDEALLTSLLLVGRHKDGITIDRPKIGEVIDLTARFLARDGWNGDEARIAILHRAGYLARRRHVADLEAWEGAQSQPAGDGGE